MANYKFLRGHFPYDTLVPRLPGKPRFITFLRNPVTQFISNFEMRQRVLDPMVGLHDTLASLTFEQFLDRPELVIHFSNLATRLIGGEYYQDGVMYPHLERAKERISGFDFVGITEHFDKSLNLFTYIYNYEPINAYETLNVSPGREKRSEVPQHLLDRVAEIQQYDIELYKSGLEIYKNMSAQMEQEKAAGSPPVALGTLVQKISVDFRRVGPGMGWHVGETHPLYGPTRWSGPGATSYLQFHLQPDQSYIVRFRILKYLELDVLRSLRLEVNGLPIPLKSWRDDVRKVIFEGVIPSTAMRAGVPSTLAFKINRTLPANHKSLTRKLRAFLGNEVLLQPEDDSRLLGLCYDWLEIVPA
jgi:hypothetical protein